MANTTTQTKRKRIYFNSRNYQLAAIAKPDGEIVHYHNFQTGFKSKNTFTNTKN